MTHPTLKDIFDLSREVIVLATDRKITLATAESCTGGLIGAAITSIPGSSTPFKGGIIAYDNSVKSSQLSVPLDLITKHGAVSSEVAEAMAKGAVEALNVDLAVSITGVAGPGGGTEDKPVGTVWMGLAFREGGKIKIDTKLHQFGDIGRNKVRDMTCYEALIGLRDRLSQA